VETVSVRDVQKNQNGGIMMIAKTSEIFTAASEVHTCYILESLKLVESYEMREHLYKWLVSGYVRHPIETCAEIVLKAPVPTEQKLPALKLMLKHEDRTSPGSKIYLKELRRVVSGRGSDDSGEIPGRLGFPTPFALGDIVITDCRPFGERRNVVILENNDTFNYVDGDGVTCLFLNDSNNIDVGYFKSNEFLTYPDLTHVSVLYRAKRYVGELPESESMLKVISEAVKANPGLGNIIFRRLCMFRIPVFDRPRNIGAFDCKRFGISWNYFRKEFGFK
jgi:hypothetical protein